MVRGGRDHCGTRIPSFYDGDDDGDDVDVDDVDDDDGDDVDDDDDDTADDTDDDTDDGERGNLYTIKLLATAPR